MKHNATPVAQIGEAVKAAMPKRFNDWTCVDESQPSIDGKKCCCLTSRCPNPANN
jgi:hypothetical protein